MKLLLILGILVLALGYYLHAANAQAYDQCHSVVGGIVKALDVRSASQCGDVDRKRLLSMSLLGIGAVLSLVSLVRISSSRSS